MKTTNEEQQAQIDGFIQSLTTEGKMNSGEILEACEDMGYETNLNHIHQMFHKHPHKISNSEFYPNQK